MLSGLPIPLQRVVDTSGAPPRARVWRRASNMGLHTYEYAARAAYSSNVWVSIASGAPPHAPARGGAHPMGLARAAFKAGVLEN